MPWFAEILRFVCQFAGLMADIRCLDFIVCAAFDIVFTAKFYSFYGHRLDLFLLTICFRFVTFLLYFSLPKDSSSLSLVKLDLFYLEMGQAILFMQTNL